MMIPYTVLCHLLYLLTEKMEKKVFDTAVEIVNTKHFFILLNRVHLSFLKCSKEDLKKWL